MPWLLLLLTGVPLHADNELRSAALLDVEVAQVLSSCQLLFIEAWEESGGFGGYAGSAMEAGQITLDLEPIRERAAETLAASLDSATRAALSTFVDSGAGQQYAWLSRELVSADGQNDLVRYGRTVHERLPPERVVRLEALDRATGASAMERWIVDKMVGVVNLAAAQITGLTGEAAEWDNPAAEVNARLQDLAARRAFIGLSYRTSRLDDRQLGALIDWAESSAGQAFHAARQDVLRGVVEEIAERFGQAQQVAINTELAEYRRENEEDEENGDEEDEESGRDGPGR